MGDAIALYGRYLGISLRGKMQYRLSFAFQASGQFLITGIEFLGLWALFSRFDSISGWRFEEVALFYGIVNVAFAFADAFARGFDLFGTTVRQGDFDRVLLRPRSVVLQLAGQELAIHRVGRLLQGAAVLAWAAWSLDVSWHPGALALLLFTVFGGACLFLGLFVLQATLSFWTIETLELMNVVTYGGVQTAQYPLAIYGARFRRFFTWVVPLGCVAYYPVVALTGRADPLGSPLWWQQFSPLAGVLFLLLSFAIFRIGVRHYTSTGS